MHHKYRIVSSLNRPFFYNRQYAGSHTSPIPGDAPVVDLAAELIAQPRSSHWCKQNDVQRELGLADLAVSTYQGISQG